MESLLISDSMESEEAGGRRMGVPALDLARTVFISRLGLDIGAGWSSTSLCRMAWCWGRGFGQLPWGRPCWGIEGEQRRERGSDFRYL
jgi:hypothetical protein